MLSIRCRVQRRMLRQSGLRSLVTASATPIPLRLVRHDCFSGRRSMNGTGTSLYEGDDLDDHQVGRSSQAEAAASPLSRRCWQRKSSWANSQACQGSHRSYRSHRSHRSHRSQQSRSPASTGADRRGVTDPGPSGDRPPDPNLYLFCRFRENPIFVSLRTPISCRRTAYSNERRGTIRVATRADHI